jgi:predicted N-formylglutamate amidohydrolase
MKEEAERLLAQDEPAPVTVYNERASSPFLLVADHAGNVMPRSLGRLGLPAAECERHIALDIGIARLGRLLAEALDATLIQQNYSRLVIDCNRPPGSPASIPELSELTRSLQMWAWAKKARVRAPARFSRPITKGSPASLMIASATGRPRS